MVDTSCNLVWGRLHELAHLDWSGMGTELGELVAFLLFIDLNMIVFTLCLPLNATEGSEFVVTTIVPG